MAEEEQDQRTEHPTSKRLDEARERGQLPISREIVSWTVILAILIIVAWIGPDMVRRILLTLRIFIEAPHAFILDDQGLQTVIFNSLGQVAMAAGLTFVVLAAAVILGYMSQTGLFASAELIKFDFARLSPVNGLKRLFSLNTLVEVAKSMGKLVLLGGTVFIVFWPLIGNLPALTGLPLLGSMDFLHHQAIRLIIILLLVFTLIALGDLFYQRHQYIKNLRMTKAEVKDEFKQQEGDPMIKGRLRQIRLEKARKRMMAQVPKADVVVTNPTHYAVALQYDNMKMAAPMVLAKGVDRIAARIRETAEEHKIPVITNPPLARAIYETVDIDEEIPTQHYRAVAEIISFVYKLKKRKF
jgi:flagellar biosynthetic protein FlhB